jgi:hypothetical protein
VGIFLGVFLAGKIGLYRREMKILGNNFLNLNSSQGKTVAV